jgi:hypothetical protein
MSSVQSDRARDWANLLHIKGGDFTPEHQFSLPETARRSSQRQIRAGAQAIGNGRDALHITAEGQRRRVGVRQANGLNHGRDLDGSGKTQDQVAPGDTGKAACMEKVHVNPLHASRPETQAFSSKNASGMKRRTHHEYVNAR